MTPDRPFRVLSHEQIVERYEAFCALLALPDPPEMPKRGRKYLQPGADSKRRETLKRDLERAYSRERVADAGRAESSIVCVRRGAGAFQIRRRA